MNESLAEPIVPHSDDAEAALIGSVCLDRQAWVECQASISPSMFFNSGYAAMWGTVSAMYGRGADVDGVTLRQELSNRGMLNEVGGAAGIAVALGTVCSSAHASTYASIVADLFRKREIIRVANGALRDVFSPTKADEPSSEALQRLMDGVAGITQTVMRPKSIRIGELLDATIAGFDAPDAELIETGLYALDAKIRGIGLGEMVLVGARPSMGKSTLCRQVWINAMMADIPAALVSLEEGPTKIARNVLANIGRVDNHKLRQPKFLSVKDKESVNVAATGMRQAPGFVVANTFRLDQIHAELSLLKARHGIKLVMIDYLQRVQARGKDRYEQVSNASMGISNMLKELNVAGLVPVQLNRGLEHRDDKRPTMADLRDSGQIEQDADGILFLHREDYYHIDDAEYVSTGTADLIVSKWRDGIRGDVVTVDSRLNYQAFESNSPI